ncbi:MAG TPA: hypothetical protein VHX15_20420 [Frankiaceae bacterium]|nr:hypothetical protein [Frankiaceae bacterium]
MSVTVSFVGTQLYWGGSLGGSSLTITYYYILPLLILILFTLRRNRITGVLGVAWLAIFLYQHQLISTVGFIQLVPLQAAGFALLIARPKRQLPAGRLLWPAPAAAWLLYQLTLLGEQSGVGKITPVLTVLALLPWAPALAVGLALDWGLTAIYYLNLHSIALNDPHLLVEAAEFAIGIPLALLIASVGRRLSKRE